MEMYCFLRCDNYRIALLVSLRSSLLAFAFVNALLHEVVLKFWWLWEVAALFQWLDRNTQSNRRLLNIAR